MQVLGAISKPLAVIPIVNKYMWDETDYGCVASFDFEGKTFEVRVHTDEEKNIKTCAIHEWLNPNDYIEG